ncbi:hypothetical protein [Phytohabitans houttuyneae]|uniref:hypothetical protein n=1 Tax=Phytohabitans houttuyneae TaxID=1076126 RepID=UPI0015652029|nr:hypothetical protein [Phytohabitans houttuyneae]
MNKIHTGLNKTTVQVGQDRWHVKQDLRALNKIDISRREVEQDRAGWAASPVKRRSGAACVQGAEVLVLDAREWPAAVPLNTLLDGGAAGDLGRLAGRACASTLMGGVRGRMRGVEA